MGMLAQEVEKVFPQWITTDREGYKLLGMEGFEALTVEALRELKEENGTLKEDNQELSGTVSTLESRIKTLEEKLASLVLL